MRAEYRVAGCRLLDDSECDEAVLTVAAVVGPQRVHPGCLQPLLRPGRQVPAGRFLQRGEQVPQGGVAPGILREVGADPGQEVVPAHVGDELLEYGRALGVGDSVEVGLHGLDVRGVGGDRMGRRELVLPVRPRLRRLGECSPGLRPASRLSLRRGARPGGERLVQPEVVPPAHGDKIAEPHVRHLMQDPLGTALPDRVRHPRAVHAVLGDRHAAGILHGAFLELRHEKLVVLAKGVSHAE